MPVVFAVVNLAKSMGVPLSVLLVLVTLTWVVLLLLVAAAVLIPTVPIIMNARISKLILLKFSVLNLDANYCHFQSG